MPSVSEETLWGYNFHQVFKLIDFWKHCTEEHKSSDYLL